MNPNNIYRELLESKTKRLQFFRRTLILAMVWLGMNGPDPKSWMIGVPLCLVGAFTSLALSPKQSPRLHWKALLPFILLFVWESIRGGWDVATRVLHRQLPITPGFIQYTTTLPQDSARRLFVNVVSLLPGTVSADLNGKQIAIHAINKNDDLTLSLGKLEKRLGNLFIPESAGLP
jgi:multicomponent Na+:H+ antiporter subunit E